MFLSPVASEIEFVGSWRGRTREFYQLGLKFWNRKLFRNLRRIVVMALRIAWRQAGLLQTGNKPVIRRLPVYNAVIRRYFGVYPARRAEGGGSARDGSGRESPAGDSSSTGTNSVNAAEPAPEPAVKDVPPPPPKREVDPKDHELAELKVSLSHDTKIG
jgi:hypothetical protein